MKEVSEVHFRIVDHGLFLPIARRLAREAGRVSYWTPADVAFPTVKDSIGDGFPDIERVSSMWQDKDSVDCFVFPDCGFCDEQQELIEQGCAVWGARKGDILEVSRGTFLDTLAKTELAFPDHEKIEGITALREHLRDKEDKYIKISRFRGDWETFHWRSWQEDELFLDQKAVAFGPFRERIIFYVFDPITTDIEDGCDAWCIDGQFPDTIIHGHECKDQSYIGTFQKLSDLPEEVRCVNETFGPILGRYGYRSFFSTEVRITKEGESYFIDPTCRAGSPPSQCMTEMIGNYAEIIWHGANGQLVEPEPAAKFAVQAVLELKGDESNWLTMAVDDELDRWVKASHCMMLDDHLWLAPDPTSHYLNWVVGIGDRIEEAIKHLKHNVSLLPEGASCDFSAMAELLKEVEQAEEKNMEFTDQPVPSPEIVLEST